MRRRFVLLALIALAVPTRAQEASEAEAGGSELRRIGEYVVMGYAGYAAGAISSTLVGSALARAGASDAAWLSGAVVVYPIGVAGGVYGVGRLLGVEGSFRNTLGDAVTGTAVGLVAGGAILWLAARSHDGDPIETEAELVDRLVEGFGYTILATGMAALTPVVWAVSDFRVAPSTFRSPTGETTPGASLLLRF